MFCDVVLRHVDRGEQLRAVAHRDAILVLGVSGFDIGGLRARHRAAECRDRCKQRNEASDRCCGWFHRRLRRTCAPPNVWQEGILTRLLADAKIRAVRFRKPFAVQLFPHTTLEVVDAREIPVRGLLVQQQGQHLTVPLDAPIELRIGLRKRTGLQIRSSELEVAQPCIQKAVRIVQYFDRLTWVSLLQRDLAFDDLSVRLRLGGQLRAQRRRDCLRVVDGTRVDEGSGCQEPDFRRLADCERLL